MRFLLALFLVGLSASSASAFSNGRFGSSGKQAGTCVGCHGDNAPAPTVSLTNAAGDAVDNLNFQPGGTADLFLVIRPGNATGLAAGFGMATSRAGRFEAVDEGAVGAGGNTTKINNGNLDNELTHAAKQRYDNSAAQTSCAGGLLCPGAQICGDNNVCVDDTVTEVRFPVSLRELQAGKQTIFVAVNDVNLNNATSNDRVVVVRFTLPVCGNDSDSDGVGDLCDSCPGVADSGLDGDSDGVDNACDNCAIVANAGQQNGDGDAAGDACDVCQGLSDNGADGDRDGDGDTCDNCPAAENADQANLDGDNDGDSCDDDIDGDNLSNAFEASVGTDPRKVDTDDDTIGDDVDNCRTIANTDQKNQYSSGAAGVPPEATPDAEGDVCDDTDGDTRRDVTEDENGNGVVDNGETDPTRADTDGDGQCDGARDIATVCTAGDPCPTDAENACTVADTDLDTIADPLDNCPAVANLDQVDSDRDFSGDACDDDDDGDGVNDVAEVAAGTNPGEADSDDDGACDGLLIVAPDCTSASDPCPTDASDACDDPAGEGEGEGEPAGEGEGEGEGEEGEGEGEEGEGEAPAFEGEGEGEEPAAGCTCSDGSAPSASLAASFSLLGAGVLLLRRRRLT